MSQIKSATGLPFPIDTSVLIIGAGACGLTAALAAHDAGADVIVLERDASPSGSTALSSGFIPAAPTRFQAALGIDDDVEQFIADLQAKAHGRIDPDHARAVVDASGPVVEWLADVHGLEWRVLDDFLYPGHSRHRMHAVPEKTGGALMARLLAAVENAGIPIVTQAHVTALFADDDSRIRGVEITRPDATIETIACKTLILACCGYAGNEDLIARHIPDMENALYFGHAGNQGDALLWGKALGAASSDLTAYQGHGSVAHPHGVLITWALMMEGGIQVNAEGRRFSNEHEGYSEQAVKVLAQPGGVAWAIYDERLHQLGLTFPDYVEADRAGAIRAAPTIAALAESCGLPADALQSTIDLIAAYQSGSAACPFGRGFSSDPAIRAPYYAVKVTGALFHSQGGLVVDAQARVLRPDGSPLPNLFAGGGAACGVSGPDVTGYLSGNGLLTAITLGRLAGDAAARQS